jgi:hypothetical protein
VPKETLIYPIGSGGFGQVDYVLNEDKKKRLIRKYF